MIGTGKIVDSNGNIIAGANIIESNANGIFIMPVAKVIESNENGIFQGDFKNNTFYTATYVGTKRMTFNTANGIPAIIKLIDDNTLPEVIVKPKRNYYWWIIAAIGIYIISKKK